MDERTGMSRDELGIALSALGADLAFPRTPSLVEAVTARLVDERSAGRRPPFPAAALWRRRRVVVLVAVGVLAALALAAAARLAIGSFQIRVQPDASPSASTPPIEPEDIGEATTLPEVEAAAGFEIALPAGPPPDEVYVVHSLSGDPGIVVAWQAGAPYPTIAGTKWSLVLMAFQGDAEVVTKTVGAFEDVREVGVDGQRAFWISVPHDISFETEGGTRGPYPVLGNVLIWAGPDGITYRLETALGRAEAIELAESAT